ncbi:MAG: IPT/TIG domain-containing protein [Balneolaceae bacterium]
MTTIRPILAILPFLLLLTISCSETPSAPGIDSGSGNNDGGGTPNDGGGEETPELVVSGVEPTTVQEGATLTIEGEELVSNDAETTVYIDDQELVIEEASSSELVVNVPEGTESGTLRVVVGDVEENGPEITVEPADDSGGTGSDSPTDPGPTAYTVSGTILEQGSSTPVEGAVIRTNDETPIETTSDASGAFELSDLKGPVQLTISHENLQAPLRSRLVLGETSNLEWELASSFTDPEDGQMTYQYREACSQGTGCDIPFDIWIADSNGNNREKLTDDTGWDLQPDWSPDREQIVFASDRDRDDGAYYLWVMDADGGNQESLGVEGFSPTWSPKEERILFVLNGEIYETDLQGNTSLVHAPSQGSAASPAWSPDGSHILFTLRDGSTSTIWAVEADGDHPGQLSESGTTGTDPDWHPRGDGILFADGSPATLSRMYLMDLDGQNRHRNENWPDHSQLQPVFSLDGTEILYTYRNMIPIR